MKNFTPVEADLKIFNDLKTRIDIEEKDIIQKCSNIQEKKIKFKKDVKNSMIFHIFISFLTIPFAIPLVFSEIYALPFIAAFLLYFLFMSFISTYVYIKSDLSFERTLTTPHLSSIYLNTEELKLIAKFIGQERLKHYLSHEGLKISLKTANDILISKYYQQNYMTNVAKNMANELTSYNDIRNLQ